MLQRVAARSGDNLLLVDIGGATTDIFSTVEGRFLRTVSANLGMSYSATEVLIQAGESGIRQWLSDDIKSEQLINLIMNKTVRPTTIPDSKSELAIEHALARAAMQLAFGHHVAFSEQAEDVSVGDHFGQHGHRRGITPMNVDTIIGSGGVISHAPEPRQSAAMLVDAFLPEGVTRLAKDAIFMMPHLGVLSRICPEAADDVFEADCLTLLGTCVAPKGRGKPGRGMLRFTYRQEGASPCEGTLKMGELKWIPLSQGEKISMTLHPAWGVDVGKGPGKSWSGDLFGGPAGIILDGRGRPTLLPSLSSGVEIGSAWSTLFEENSHDG
jgi:hypothetical protein